MTSFSPLIESVLYISLSEKSIVNLRLLSFFHQCGIFITVQNGRGGFPLPLSGLSTNNRLDKPVLVVLGEHNAKFFLSRIEGCSIPH